MASSSIKDADSAKRTSSWSNRFILAAIVQGAIITGLTLFFVGAQVLISGINIIQFLSLSFEGPAKWFFLGYIFYLIIVVAVAVTAVFYNHLEVDMNKRIRGFRSALVWVHLIGMNVGGAATTITMIFAGLVGTGIIDVILSGGSAASMQPNVTIMEQFVTPIAVLAGLLSIGVLAGGLAYISVYFQRK
ncbi:MAG: hypothetical protein ACREA4_07520 [Nitrososphaera sp.]